jgi:hypothetical protein
MTIKLLVEKFIADRPHHVGETVQFGWFIFRIAERGRPPRIESLDFRQIASFTEDFSEVERIHSLQTAALVQFNASESPCTLWQSALVSASYSPRCSGAFLERQAPTDGNDSGWYVGVFNDTRDMDDIDSFGRRSLYELTIHDMRMAPYWLLPRGTIVSLTPEQTRAHT